LLDGSQVIVERSLNRRGSILSVSRSVLDSM
jgi:hypothetical protein